MSKLIVYKTLFLLFIVIYNLKCFSFNSDSLNIMRVQNKKKNNQLSGIINNRNHYGFIPYLNSSTYPGNYSELDGQVNFSIKELPLITSFYYANRPFITGINNYFNISLDVPKLSDNLRNKGLKQISSIDDSLINLQKQKQEFEKQKEYNKFQMAQIEKGNTKPNLQFPEKNWKDSISIADLDTNNFSFGNKSLSDSKTELSVEAYQQNINDIEQKIRKINEIEQRLKNEKELLSNQTNKNDYTSFLSGFRRLEVGFFNPDFSTYLISGVPVKGAYSEWYKKNTFLAIATGVSQVNNLIRNNTLSDVLKNQQNPFNFFDFGFNTTNNKLMSVKTGKGEKSNSHIYAGILWANSAPIFKPETNNLAQTNIVLELDGRIKLSNSQFFDIIIGKSYLFDKGSSIYLFSSEQLNISSYATQVSYKLDLKKTRFELSSRYIMPHFKSFGVGFMRPDNYRIEAKLKHTFNKHIRAGIIYRYERDNLDNLFEHTNHFTRFGGELVLKPLKRLVLSNSYLPLNYLIFDREKNIVFRNENNMYSSTITYNHNVFKKSIHTLTLSYNNLKITSDSLNLQYENLVFVSDLVLNKNVENIFSSTGIFSNSIDTLASNVLLLKNEIKYTAKNKFIVAIAGKYSISEYKNELGYKLSLSKPFIKYLTIELSGERILRGEYFINQSYIEISQIPYYFLLNIQLKF